MEDPGGKQQARDRGLREKPALCLKWMNPLPVWSFEARILRWEDTPLMWAPPSAGSLSKDTEEGSFRSLPACSLKQVHSFTGVRAYVFGILMHTEDQLRHPALWTEKLLDSWTFHHSLPLLD